MREIGIIVSVASDRMPKDVLQWYNLNDCFTHVGCDPLTLNIPHKEYVCRQFIVEAALHVVLLAVNMHSFFQ